MCKNSFAQARTPFALQWLPRSPGALKKPRGSQTQYPHFYTDRCCGHDILPNFPETGIFRKNKILHPLYLGINLFHGGNLLLCAPAQKSEVAHHCFSTVMRKNKIEHPLYLGKNLFHGGKLLLCATAQKSEVTHRCSFSLPFEKARFGILYLGKNLFHGVV